MTVCAQAENDEWNKSFPHQPVLADNEQALGTVDLGQSHLLVEGAIASHHHGYAVREAPIGDLRGWAQDRRCEVMNLETGLDEHKVDIYIYNFFI